MKNLYAALVLLLSSSVFGQIQHDINKNGGTTETNGINDIDSIRFNPGQTEMEIILNNGNVESHTISDIDNVTFSGQLVGEITSLDCAGATINGTLVEGVAANGVTADISYTGGNGGVHNGQTVNSTGVTGLTAQLNAGNFANGGGTLTYTITGTPNSNGTASFAILIGGISCTLEIPVDAGAISTLDCAGAIINGTLVDGVAASVVSADVGYTGGNGGPHNGQTVNSTGVTGLTAQLNAGNFANGAGTLTYTITGTPSSSGTASFAILIGGISCTLEIPVDAGAISTLDCAGATISGTLVDGVAASGVSADVGYTGGNGGPHNGQTVSSTGVTGLTATLVAGNFANGAGTLNYTITGTPSSSGTAGFAIQIGGEACTLEITVDPGSISTLDCAGATVNGTLVDGVSANNVTADISYTGGNGGPHNGQTVSSTGVTGLTATLAAGNFANGAGTLNYTITGTPNTSGTASFAIDIGVQTCTLEITVASGSVSTLDCAGATVNGNLFEGVTATGVSVDINYTGGNGGPHNGQTVNSTGVTGLMAELNTGGFLIGSGTLTYAITGTPSSDGIATFIIVIGGETCNLEINVSPSTGTFPSGYVHCGVTTSVVDVTNPSTGDTWMDRNIGASQVATSISDNNAYGDLFQWGRNGDGHQCRNSPTTSTSSSIDQPGHGSFITVNPDWRNPANTNLWQGVNGINNPCPGGYRLPTEAEINAERLSWSSGDYNGAFNSPLKLPMGGYRDMNAVIKNPGLTGIYWTSTVSSTSSRALHFYTYAIIGTYTRVTGMSVRCIKD